MASPRRWAAAAMLSYVALAGLILTAERGDPEWFVHFGSDPELSVPTALGRAVFGEDVRTPHRDGHDGRFFWVQARDPLLVDPTEAERFEDRPVYRSQRLLYPLLAAPFGLFGDHALVVGMVIVNVLAIGAGTWATARLAARRGAHRWTPLAFALNPGVFLAFALSTADALAVALVLVGLDALDRDEDLAAGLAFAAAVLAKEPMILVPLALAVRAVVAHRGGWRGVARLAGPAVVAVAAWGLYVRIRLGFAPTQIQEFTFPAGGYLEAWRQHWQSLGDWAHAGVALALVVVAGFTVHLFWTRRSVIMWAAVPFALLVPFFSAQVLVLTTHTPRAIGPLLTLLLIEAASRRASSPSPVPARPARPGSTLRAPARHRAVPS